MYMEFATPWVTLMVQIMRILKCLDSGLGGNRLGIWKCAGGTADGCSLLLPPWSSVSPGSHSYQNRISGC